MSWLAAMLGLPAEDTRLVVGVEDDPQDGSLRVYLNARYTGIHTHVPADAPEATSLRGWSAHTFVDVPADALCDCLPELTPALANRCHCPTDSDIDAALDAANDRLTRKD